ncbi:hypothetical protein [Peterkaempfera griseoplana]|uniref:hypothetical protein n=1 Tax=Peterkaempfera griseoplana TaxID=66896 RepID=UPI0006E35321|nr:hypothetical protein [Peterkaempfera griseoplana]
MSDCLGFFTCEQTARPASETGSPYLLARVEAPSPAMAAYWLLARALDVGVQLDGPGLNAVWGEIRDGDEYVKVLHALATGSEYVLEMLVGEIAYCFTVRPADLSAQALGIGAGDREWGLGRPSRGTAGGAAPLPRPGYA